MRFSTVITPIQLDVHMLYKNIQNMLLYTQLITFESDEFHSAVAKTVQEAKALIEEGFEYVTIIDGMQARARLLMM